MRLRVKLTKEQADNICAMTPYDVCKVNQCPHNIVGCAIWLHIDPFKLKLIELKYKKQEKQNG